MSLFGEQDIENVFKGSRPVFELSLPGNQGKWGVTQELHGELVRLYPGVDVMSEYPRMEAWLFTNPTHRKTPKGLPRFINTWLSKAQNTPRPTQAPTASPRGFVTSDLRCQNRNGGFQIYRCEGEGHQFASRIPLNCCRVCGEDMRRVTS